MTDIEKVAYAKSFIDKLANGINPLNDTAVSNDDIVNNVRISRCLFCVSDILRQVIDNGGTSVAKTVKHRKKEFSLTEQERARIKISEKPLTISEITKYLNSIVDLEVTKKLAVKAISEWLVSIGLLKVITVMGKSRKEPTQQGREIGIITEEKMGQYGPYTSVLYSPQAQQFIYDNIEAILVAKE